MVMIFFYGLFAASFALILELIFFGILPVEFSAILFSEISNTSLTSKMLAGIIFFAALEESARLLFLLRYRLNFFGDTPPFSHILSLGAVFGLGFAALELVLSYFSASPFSLHTFSIITLHMALSMFLALRLFPPQSSRRKIVFLWAAAVLVHSAFNWFIFLR